MSLIPDDRVTFFPKQLGDFKDGDLGFGNAGGLIIDENTDKVYLVDDVNFLFYNPMPPPSPFIKPEVIVVEKVGNNYIVDISMAKKFQKMDTEKIDFKLIEVYDVISDVIYNAFQKVNKDSCPELSNKEMVNRFLYNMYPNIADPDILQSGKNMLLEEKTYVEKFEKAKFIAEQLNNPNIFKPSDNNGDSVYDDDDEYDEYEDDSEKDFEDYGLNE